MRRVLFAAYILVIVAPAAHSQCFYSSLPGVQIQGPYVLPNAEVSVPYEYLFRGAGVDQPVVFFIQSNSRLPSGLELSMEGLISGRAQNPTTNLEFTVFMYPRSGPIYAACNFRMSVIANRLALATTELPSGSVGASYSANVRGANGAEPYRYELVSGTYPPGLQIFANGAILGTPTTAGTYTFRMRVTDANGNRIDGDVRIVVDGSGLLLDAAALPSGEVGIAYSGLIRATPASPAATFQVASGQLPPGLTLAASGAITGTPQSVGDFPFRVRANANALTAEGSYSIRIGASTRPLTLTEWTNARFAVGLATSQQIPTLGGGGGLRFTLLEGVVPAGLSVSTTGAVTGTPRRAGAYDQRWRVTDSAGASAERAYRLVVESPRAYPEAVAGQRYSQRDGLVGATRYSLDSTSKLPLGMRIDPDGTLSGTPFAAGDFQFVLRVESGAAVQSIPYLLRVGAPSTELELDTIDLPAAIRGRAYRQALVALSSIERVQSIEGELPPGLIWNGATIEGTPSREGSWEFLVDLRAAGRSTSRRFSIVVAAAGGPVIDAIVSSASYQGGAVAPGEILTLFGEQLEGARVRVDGVLAPILYALPQQASFVMPFGAGANGTALVWIERSGSESYPLRLRVIESRPGLYTVNGSGQGPAAALYPAPSVVVLFGTGLGLLESPVVDGEAATAATQARLFASGDLKATVDGLDARILYAGAGPGLIHGAAQINVQLPAELTPGIHKLKLTAKGRSSGEVEVEVK